MSPEFWPEIFQNARATWLGVLAAGLTLVYVVVMAILLDRKLRHISQRRKNLIFFMAAAVWVFGVPWIIYFFWCLEVNAFGQV